MGKNIFKNASKIVSGRYSQKLVDHTRHFATDALKTVSEKAIQKKSRSNW